MSLVPLLLVVIAAVRSMPAGTRATRKRRPLRRPTFVFAYNVVAVVYLPLVIWLLATVSARPGATILLCLDRKCHHPSRQPARNDQATRSPTSVVYLIARGTGLLFSSIGAFILLREPPTWLGILGLVAVVIGIVAISTQGNLAAFRQPKGQEGVRWGLGTGSIAAYTVVDGYGVKVLGLHPGAARLFSNFLRLLFWGRCC